MRSSSTKMSSTRTLTSLTTCSRLSNGLLYLEGVLRWDFSLSMLGRRLFFADSEEGHFDGTRPGFCL